jgi:hypothetical protein
MRKAISVPAAGLAFVLVGCANSAPTATPADTTVCRQFNSVLNTHPATHTWTWLQSAFQVDPPPDTELSSDMNSWLDLMAAGGWAPGSGEQTLTAKAAYSVQQYCDSIHDG